MPQLSWLTDPHLDFLRPAAQEAFIEELARCQQDGLLLTGDIAEASSLLPILSQLDQHLSKPIWFVLGNHDYYRGSIVRTRAAVRRWCKQSRHSHWLPDAGVVTLTKTTALVGHGGWGDGGYGDFLGSTILLNDYRMIEELQLSRLGRERLFAQLQHQGREAAAVLRPLLEDALASHREVLLLTHVPPFVEACWHEGRAVLNEWTPHFTCRAVGALLLELMARHADRKLRVLCGHTHSPGVAWIRPNLVVHTGGAVYRQPALQATVEVA